MFYITEVTIKRFHLETPPKAEVPMGLMEITLCSETEANSFEEACWKSMKEAKSRFSDLDDVYEATTNCPGVMATAGDWDKV